jgi:DNA-binding transcriptional regulator YhcF (GntR family)
MRLPAIGGKHMRTNNDNDLKGNPDPVLSPREMSQDAGISMATWRRVYRQPLAAAGALIQLSPGRIGTRRSKWRRALEQNTEKKAG